MVMGVVCDGIVIVGASTCLIEDVFKFRALRGSAPSPAITYPVLYQVTKFCVVYTSTMRLAMRTEGKSLPHVKKIGW